MARNTSPSILPSNARRKATGSTCGSARPGCVARYAVTNNCNHHRFGQAATALSHSPSDALMYAFCNEWRTPSPASSPLAMAVLKAAVAACSRSTHGNSSATALLPGAKSASTSATSFRDPFARMST